MTPQSFAESSNTWAAGCRFLASPIGLAQRRLLHFADRGARQGADQRDAPRNLVAADVRPAMVDDLLGRERHTGFGHDDREQRLAVPIVGNTDDRRLADAGVTVQNGLDFAGVNVLAAGDDHVLLAVDQEEIPILVEAPEVAGMKPSVPENLCILPVALQIALAHVGSADHNFPCLPRWQRPAIVFEDAQFHAGQWPARRL